MENIFLVAGGTGGHINAALALGEQLQDHNYHCIYLTGKRHLDYALFKNVDCLHLDVSPLRFKNPLKLIKGILVNLNSMLSLWRIYREKKPRFIVGAGGYVCGPTLLMGFLLRRPIFIVEQNAVAGLTNRILGWISNKIFLHFQNTKGLSKHLEQKAVVAGNPTRKKIYLALTSDHNEVIDDNVLKIFVFGGSLGAKQVNELISLFCKKQRANKIWIKHQTGKGGSMTIDHNEMIKYEQSEYIDNIDEYYRWADLIVGRAGASTISELRIVQKPVILIPFPFATDNHQYFNAIELKNEAKFLVEIFDHTQQTSLMVERLDKVIETVYKLKKNRELPFKSVPPANSTNIIIEEIEKNVRT